jgi:2-oxoglutarate ferredoxin oxidoreductase subunit delta
LWLGSTTISKQRKEIHMATVRGTVTIDVETCKGCELCIAACPQESLTLSHEINKQGYHYAVLIQDNCTGCVNCALVCPDAVITVYRTKKGSSKKEAVAVLNRVQQDVRVTLQSAEEIPQGAVSI